MTRAAAAAFFLALASFRAAPAQDLPSFTFQGTVVDALTSHPIPRALVQSQDRRLATLTDSEGRFSFPIAPLLPAAISIGLLATRPGYLESSEQVANLTAATPALTFRLTPAASISGHVSASGVNAAGNVAVTLYSRSVDAIGNLAYLPAGNQTTDSHGDFHFTGLLAGSYTLGTATWLLEELYPPRTGPAQQYPGTFYGGTPSLETSLKIPVTAGTSTLAEIQLHLATYYSVEVPIAGSKAIASEIVVEIPGTDRFGLPSRYLPDRNVYVCWLQPGPHTLNFFGGNDQRLFATTTLTVADAPLRALPVTLTPLANIPVHLHEQFNHPEQPSETKLRPDRFNRVAPPIFINAIQLQTAIPAMSSGFIEVPGAPPGRENFLLSPIPPGTYAVTAISNHGYVAALSSGSTDLLRQPLQHELTSSPPPIEVTLRDDGATFDITPEPGPTPSSGSATVVLLPADGSGNPIYRINDGNKFENIPPGTYRVFAMESRDRGPLFAHRDPATLAIIEAKATLVKALPNQHVTVTAPLLELPTVSIQRRFID